MEFDYKKLKHFIKNDKRIGSVNEYANFLGITRVSLSYKLHNKRRFSVEEIEKTRVAFNLTNEEIKSYFFSSKVDKRQYEND